jgi:hypothetical protein
MGIVMKKLGQRGGPAGQDKEVMNTNNPTKKKKAAPKMGGGAMKKKVMGYDKGGKMALPKRKPRHANPNHPMNAERTTGHPDGVTRKTRGGKVKKYDKGGSVTKEQKLAALKEAMKGVGKGGSGAGDSKMGKMIKEIGFPMSNKKAGGSVKAAKHGGSMCRGGGAATRGTKFKAT